MQFKGSKHALMHIYYTTVPENIEYFILLQSIDVLLQKIALNIIHSLFGYI